MILPHLALFREGRGSGWHRTRHVLLFGLFKEGTKKRCTHLGILANYFYITCQSIFIYSFEMFYRRKEMSIVVGYVDGWNVSGTNKAVQFYLLSKSDNPNKRKADELEEAVQTEVDEIQQADYIPIRKNTSLPSYSCFLEYTIEVFRSEEDSVYQVSRILHIKKRGECIQRKNLIDIMTRGKKEKQIEAITNSISKLPAQIRDIKTDVDDRMKMHKFYPWVHSIVHMFFKTQTVYDLMRYFPYTFLEQFTEMELQHVKKYILTNPHAFCFPDMVKRDLKKVEYRPPTSAATVSPITGLPKKRIAVQKVVLFGAETSICDGVDNRLYHTSDNFWREAQTTDGIYMSMNYPYWNYHMYKCFCGDNQLEVDPKIEAHLVVYKALENYSHSYGKQEFTLSYMAYQLEKPAEDIRYSFDFLIENRILSRYPFEDGTKAANEIYLSENIIFQRVLDLEDMVFHFLRDRCLEIYFLSTCHYSSPYFKGLLQLHTKHAVGLVVTHSIFSKRYIKEETGLSSYLWSELMHLQQKMEFNKIKTIMIEGVHKMDAYHLAFVCRFLSAACCKEGLKVILVGDNQEHGAFSRCFCPNYLLSALCDSFRVTANSHDMIRRSIQNPNKIVQGIDDLLHKTVTDLVTENIVDIKMSKLCKLSKPEKKEKKSLQMFCATEKDKETVLKELCVNEKLYGGPNRFSIGDKVQSVEDGWSGEIKSAAAFTESGGLREIEHKKFIYTQIAPHKLDISFEKMDTKTVLTRRKTIRNMLFETAKSYPGIIVDRGLFYLSKDATIQDILSSIKYCKSNFKIVIPNNVTLSDIFSKHRTSVSRSLSGRIDTIKDKIVVLQ